MSNNIMHDNVINKLSDSLSNKNHHEVLRLDGLRKSYNIGQPNEIEVLHGIDLYIGVMTLLRLSVLLDLGKVRY